jgi:transposase InsO family protein
MLKMDRAIKGIEHSSPTKDGKPKVKPAKTLHQIDIACIGAEAFTRHLKNPNAETFITSLYEIDRAIDEKQAPEITDDAEMQALIDRVLPERYRSFRDVFSKNASDELSPHRPYDLKIELQGQATDYLRYSPLYKHTAEELEAAKQYIQDNLHKGFIAPSGAPFASPILFSRKHDGGLRFCVDYRKLNAITKKNQYPLPLIDETLERLSRAKFFTKLDIRQAFHKIRIHPDSEDLTTFRTRYGSYKYRVVPFGLTNGPATFQRFINDSFMDCLDDFLTAYLDDLLIYSENELDHELHVRKVLTRLREVGLQADIKKCEFHVRKTKYLGFIVGEDGIEVDPEKISVLKNWQVPNTVRGVQSFLGFCNFYRRFIRNYGRIARPLVKLTRKNVPFKFDEACQKAFRELKNRLLSAPILIHYRPNRATKLETDSSDGVVGAVLSQLYEEDNQWHPVAFFSKTMAPAECNYGIHDKEILAIIRALQEYRAELEGLQREERFDILTDHRALEYFMTTKALNSRQANWAEYLSRFHFMIRYRPGKGNTLADALSRREDAVQQQNVVKKEAREQTLLPAECLDPKILEELAEIDTATGDSLGEARDDVIGPDISSDVPATLYLVDRLLQANRTHTGLDPYREKARSDDEDWTLKDGLVLFKNRLVVPEDDSLKVKLVDEAHKQPSIAHPGKAKTKQLVKARYYWPKMDEYIDRYVKNCHTCRRFHTPKDLPPGLLKPLPIPDRPWQHISMDFRSYAKDKHGFDNVVVFVDRMTKRPVSIPCHKNIDAKETARIFLTHIYRQKGAPVTIVSDRGSQFISDFWDEFCSLIRTKLKLSTAAHPETDGQTEIVNQYMSQRIRPFVNYFQDDWSEWLPMVDFAASCLPHESTGVSPFFAECGYEPRLSIDWDQAGKPGSRKERINREEADQFVQRMQEIWDLVKGSMQRAQERQKKQADRHRREIDFDVGDSVWVTTKEWRTGRPIKKLDSQMEGPYKILERVGNAYKLDLPPSIKVHPIIAAARLRKAASDPVPGQHPDPPPPIEVNGEAEWEVEKILASRLFRKKTLQYRAKWVGYDTDPEWYNAQNFKASPHMLRDFHKDNPSAAGPPTQLSYWIECWEQGEEPEDRSDDNRTSPA